MAEIVLKVVLITGAARGIGKEIALALREKYQVVVLDIDRENLNLLKKEYPEVDSYECNVADSEQVEKTIKEIFTKHQKIDVLINNAGIIHNEPLISFSPEGLKKHSPKSWNKVIDINLNSVFFMTSNVVEKMLLKRTKGVIINISSISSRGNAGQTAYSAAKAAVNALTVTWAKELGTIGIRSVAISPGFIDTDSTHLHLTPEKEKELLKKIPLRKFGQLKNIVETIFFVLENDYLNGKIIEVDGGISL